jgi:hypothetical protein
MLYDITSERKTPCDYRGGTALIAAAATGAYYETGVEP